MRVVGVSRDPMKKHEKFIGKYGLAVPLASDEDGRISDAFGTWVQKSMYGRKYMGMERATYPDRRRRPGATRVAQGQGPGHAAEVLAAARELRRHSAPDFPARARIIISQWTTLSYIARTGIRSSSPWARSSSG